MDVDEDLTTLQLFDLSSQGFPFRGSVVHNIETRRALLSDTLIFDLLLSAGGIPQPSSVYPPEDAHGLARLLSKIEDCTYDRLKKNGLVYYLLKWHDVDGGYDRAGQYARQSLLPPHFAMLADAYWALDNGVGLEHAVSLLADRRLSRDYTSKILHALALGTTNASTSTDIYYAQTRVPSIHLTAPFILRYIRAAKPTLIEPLDLDLYLVALAEGDGADASTALTFTQAWNFQRTFPDGNETRERLFKLLLEWALTPSPRAKPLRALLSLPLSPYEQALLKDQALNPPHHLSMRSFSALRDLTTVRLISSGMHSAAVDLDQQFAAHAPAAPPPSSARANYAAAAKSARATREDDISVRRRAEILSTVRDAMPAVDRAILEEESALPPATSISAGPRRTRQSAADLSSSWMDVDASFLSEGAHARRPSGRGTGGLDPPHAPPIAETARAPRLGLRAPRAPEPSNSPLSHGALSGLGRRQAAPRRSEPVPPPANGANTSLRAGLFESAGSAHMARNAFYQPPSAEQNEPESISAGPSSRVNGHTTPSARVAPRTSVGPSNLPFTTDAGDEADVSRFDNDDMSVGGATPAPEMDVDDSEHAQNADTTVNGAAEAEAEAEADQTVAAPEADETVTAPDQREIPFSLFSSGAPASPTPSAAPAEEATPEEPISNVSRSSARSSGRKAHRLQRTESEQMQPPGAFFTTPTPAPEAIFEEDEPEEDEPAPSYVPKRHRVPSTPAPERMTTRRVSASMSAAKPKSAAGKAREAPAAAAPTPKRARRNIPGAMDVEDEDDGTPVPDEEEDVVPPLPRKGQRLSRARTSNGVEGEDEEVPQQHRRRSSRLSHSELDDVLNEPEVKKKSTRGKTPVKATPAATPRTRRKR